MTRAQSLSVQTLIVVALGIIVLITSILVYNSIQDPAEDGIKSCENHGGTCRPSCEPGELRDPLGECTEGLICCFGSGE